MVTFLTQCLADNYQIVSFTFYLCDILSFVIRDMMGTRQNIIRFSKNTQPINTDSYNKRMRSRPLGIL